MTKEEEAARLELQRRAARQKIISATLQMELEQDQGKQDDSDDQGKDFHPTY
jgi:hypothetical protein